jgi:hypothetical protein
MTIGNPVSPKNVLGNHVHGALNKHANDIYMFVTVIDPFIVDS